MNIIIYILAILLAMAPSVYAAPVRGTHPVVDGSLVAFSLEYDYIYDRDLKDSNINKGKIREENTVYGKLTFKATEYASVYIKGGGTNFDTRFEFKDSKTLDETYNAGFYAGGGVKLYYEFLPKITACLDNQLNWWRSDIEEAKYSGGTVTSQSGYTSAWEYQVAGIFSYTIDYKTIMNPSYGELPQFTPYIGVKYAYLETDSNVKIKGAGFTVSPPDKAKNDTNAGVILGVEMTLESLSAFKFNIEARLLDDNAISVALDYNF
jgi:hypothetical protein